MILELLIVIFVVMTVINYICLDIRVDKIKKESLDKDKVIASLMAHNSVLRKLNAGFKDHERRVDNIEKLIGKCISSLPEKPEEPEQYEFTCKDCEFYRGLYGNYYMCNQTGCFCSTECDKPCELFKKKESLDDEEDAVYYANNVKVNVSSKEPRVYKTDEISEESTYYRIAKLYLGGGISLVDANSLLETLKR